MNKVIEFYHGWKHGGIGFTILIYQLAIGISLRWWENGPAFRLYLGPFKIWGHLKLLNIRHG